MFMTKKRRRLKPARAKPLLLLGIGSADDLITSDGIRTDHLASDRANHAGELARYLK